MSSPQTPLVVEHGHLARGNALVPFLPTPNMGGRLVPEGIILHDTAGTSMRSATDWFRDPKTKVSAHLVVDTDGSIVQMVPFDRVAWHAGASVHNGRSGCNGFMIGIEIVNPGILNEQGVAWFGQVYPQSVPVATKEHGKGRWVAYPQAQVDAVIAVCRALVEAYPSIKVITTHWAVSPGRKVDTNPLFPLDGVRAEVFGPAQPPRVLREMAAARPQAADVQRTPALPVPAEPGKEPGTNADSTAAPAPMVPPKGRKLAAVGKAVATARRSTTVRSLIIAKVMVLVGGVLGALKALWEFLCNVLDVLPSIVTDVGGTLDQGKQVSQFLSLSTEQWMAIAAVIAVPLLIVAIVRHTNDKQQLEAQEAPTQ